MFDCLKKNYIDKENKHLTLGQAERKPLSECNSLYGKQGVHEAVISSSLPASSQTGRTAWSGSKDAD